MYVPHPRIRRLSKIPLVGTAALAALIATSVACFTATPQVAQAADAPAITDMTEQDYQALGLATSEDIPADTVGPYSTDTPTTFATRSEVYMAANGSHGNRYTLRDKLENVERGDIGGTMISKLSFTETSELRSNRWLWKCVGRRKVLAKRQQLRHEQRSLQA